MFRTGEKSNLCQNDEIFFCSNLYRSVENFTELCRSIKNLEFTDLYRAKKWPTHYYNVFMLQVISEITPTKHVPEILQQQHFINTSTNPVATCLIKLTKTKSI